MNPKKVWAVARKELIQAYRDPISLAMLVGLPSVLLLLYGYAVNFDVLHAKLAVQDRDRSAASRALIHAFVSTPYFDLAAELPAGADLDRVTERRIARAVLVIPEGYSRELQAERLAPVQLLLDGSDSNTATTVLGYAQAVVVAENLARQRALAGGRLRLEDLAIDYRPRVWYNPELRSTQFLVPGLIGVILMLTAVLSTALSVVREKERGTMEQIRVTSLRPGELIAGKALPYLIISLVASSTVLLAARLLFQVEVKGSYLDLFLAILLYLLGALGFGLLISSLSHTQAMAFQIGIVTSLLPSLFLSGFIFPIHSMPVAVQAVSYLVPARYFLVILRGVIMKGAPLATYVWDGGRRLELPFLILYAAIVLSVASLRLSRKET